MTNMPPYGDSKDERVDSPLYSGRIATALENLPAEIRERNKIYLLDGFLDLAVSGLSHILPAESLADAKKVIEKARDLTRNGNAAAALATLTDAHQRGIPTPVFIDRAKDGHIRVLPLLIDNDPARMRKQLDELAAPISASPSFTGPADSLPTAALAIIANNKAKLPFTITFTNPYSSRESDGWLKVRYPMKLYAAGGDIEHRDLMDRAATDLESYTRAT